MLDNLSVAQTKVFKSSFGDVTCKIPTLKDRIEVEKRRQRYADGMMFLATEIWDQIDAQAYLDVLATETPAGFERIKQSNENPIFFGGFDWDKFYDADGIIALGKEVIEWVNSFRQGLRGEQTPVGGTGQ